MTPRCISEPVSWLRLERFRLGELDGGERTRIAEHLAACPVCAACAARIESDEAVALPPLAARAAPGVRSPARRVFAAVGMLAAAAALALGVGRAWRGPDAVATGRGEVARPKGDGMAFGLVRDDGQRVPGEGGVFRGSERFKALVTCPPSMSARFDLVVFDAAGASFPLEPARGLSCGNEVPLPGAFRVTGAAPVTVCLVWNTEGEVERGALSRAGAARDPRAMCVELRPSAD
jgi:hypothetical protein